MCVCGAVFNVACIFELSGVGVWKCCAAVVVGVSR